MAVITNIFAAFGAISSLYFLSQAYRIVSQYTRRSSLGRYLHSKDTKQGTWALVTGASDGIGVGFAEELCHRGFNVVIHGRNTSKLDNVKRSLESKFPDRQVRTLVADASITGPDAIANIKKIVAELDSLYLTVLVNNVGVGGGERQYLKFLDRTLEEINDAMAVNEGFPTLLTRALLPKLIERQPALVMNIGSVLGSWPCAYLEPYCGAKGHNLSFSRSLGMEMILEKHDVEFLHVRVMSAATQSSREPLSFMTVSPRAMARGALDRVGCGAVTTDGLFRHALLANFADSLPTSIQGPMFSDAVRAKISPQYR